jgi:hypothetical protein
MLNCAMDDGAVGHQRLRQQRIAKPPLDFESRSTLTATTGLSAVDKTNQFYQGLISSPGVITAEVSSPC